MLLPHKHPDDRAHVQDLLITHCIREARSQPSPVIDTAASHDAIVVADRMSDETGAVVGTAGYYVD